MIKRSGVIINSKFGHPVSNMLLSHEKISKNLAVIFPGGDNSTNVPALHYARKAALLCGCDVLSLQYGYTIEYTTLSTPEIINGIVDECIDVIKRTMLATHEQLFLISKSMGHFISFRVDDLLQEKLIRYISYTPLTAHIEDLSKRECKVFTGSKDKKVISLVQCCVLVQYSDARQTSYFLLERKFL